MLFKYLAIPSMLVSTLTFAQEKTDATDFNFEKAGFSPAYYFIHYDEGVVADRNDVTKGSDGKIDVNASKNTGIIGLEFHINFGKHWKYFNPNDPNNVGKSGDQIQTFTGSAGFTVSPFIGIFDIDNGINGYAIGGSFGYWKGDKDGTPTRSINLGLGRIVHKDRIVLAPGIADQVAPPSDLQQSDFTAKKDVYGYTAMLSASIGF